jgi:glycosyltransferase involved in cell wall biosynthesis
MISVIILTFNSELTIAQTLASAREVSDDIQIVDSFSNDKTLEIARQFGCSVVQHPFEHYGAQRNWAIANLTLRYEWQLHLDADEFLTQELIDRINKLKGCFPSEVNGYFIPRLTRFLGRDLRHGGHFPIWHMRLFRTGKGGCENRRYDQHFILSGRGERIHAPMVDDNRMSLREWTERHNRWADAEVQEILSPTTAEMIEPSLSGTPMQRKRALRSWYARGPLFLRALLFFIYRYFMRLGFLDGKPGLIYNVLQTFWYRFLIDAKLYEISQRQGRLALGKAQGR